MPQWIDGGRAKSAELLGLIPPPSSADHYEREPQAAAGAFALGLAVRGADGVAVRGGERRASPAGRWRYGLANSRRRIHPGAPAGSARGPVLVHAAGRAVVRLGVALRRPVRAGASRGRAQ